MNPLMLLVSILFPLAAGILLLLLPINRRRNIRLYVGAVTLSTSVLAWVCILCCPEKELTLLRFTEIFILALKLDGLGRFFAGIVATLWPLTVLYAFEYLEKDERQRIFFSFFTMAYGVTLGVAMAGDLFTMYVFYELLTLSTVPLVMHTQTKDAVRAARLYFGISLGGAAFAFIAMLFITTNGLLEQPAEIARIFYVIGFFGFGVKAAVFPLHVWLPRASVAPTPVTALLHAVAVVKAGIFSIIRLTFYSFGTDLLTGTWAQYVPLSFAAFTILYGAVRAVKESHFKRRLAYSTVANLSYILFGVLLMTQEGLQAGLLHMAFHAEMKILAFFCAGAVLHRTGREYIDELDGLGKKMPVTFVCFLFSALSLTGIPPFAGFISKWQLLLAAAGAGTVLSYIGAGVILLAALLTAVYMLSTVRRAFFPDKDADLSRLPEVREAGLRMLIPMGILAVGLLVTGLLSGRIIDILSGIL